jgi:imidazolonepropionase-like amidohydrolase
MRQRQGWIAETIRVFGFINREHIERKFGVSTPQASADLASFQDRNPRAIVYNKSVKRYEAVPSKGGPTEQDPGRPYCKPDQSCCDFCCGN